MSYFKWRQVDPTKGIPNRVGQIRFEKIDEISNRNWEILLKITENRRN
jgi:hypothetical protein